ncbi:MAG: hypothetical protein WC732_09680 [Candidatus Omnitrophota bacterium]
MLTVTVSTNVVDHVLAGDTHDTTRAAELYVPSTSVAPNTHLMVALVHSTGTVTFTAVPPSHQPAAGVIVVMFWYASMHRSAVAPVQSVSAVSRVMHVCPYRYHVQ